MSATPPETTAEPQPSAPEPPAPPPPPPAYAPPNPLYAGFWRRAAAFVLDTLILALPDYLLDRWLEMQWWGHSFLATSLLAMAYYAGFHASPWMATPGKRVLGVQVTTLRGERIGVLRAVVRYFATLLSAFVLGIGFFMAGWTARRRALHDVIAGTLVVRRGATAPEVTAGGTVMPLSGAIWATLFLAFLLPFVGGVLAAIAIPAWHDYTRRAQVRDVLQSLAPLQEGIRKAMHEGKDPVLSATPPDSRHARSIVVRSDGAISVQLRGGGSLALSPRGEDWHCTAGGIAAKHLPPQCRD